MWWQTERIRKTTIDCQGRSDTACGGYSRGICDGARPHAPVIHNLNAKRGRTPQLDLCNPPINPAPEISCSHPRLLLTTQQGTRASCSRDGAMLPVC